VLAVDGGEPARTSSADVIITVDDVDDNSPVFTQVTHQFSLPENSPVGCVVGSVTAVDGDLSPYNSIYYRLMEDDSHSFTIDPLNGLSTWLGLLSTQLSSLFIHNVVYLAVLLAQLSPATTP